MMMDDASLRKAIARVLRDPSVDMESVTPGQVRAALVTAGDLSEEEAHEQRKAIKTIVGDIFWTIKAEREQPAANGGDEDGQTEPDTESHVEEDEDESMDEEELKPKPKTTKKKKSKGLTDEELAKKLSREVNAGSRSRRNAGGKDSSGGKGTRKKKKSADIVDSDGEGSDGGKPKKKRAAGGGFKKEYSLSVPLAEIVEADKMSRPQVVKHLWDYIKARELQNPNDKREIVCDGKLRAMFGVDRINMFKMNKVLGEHLHEA